MISVVDLAFELWFANSNEPQANKEIWRTNVFTPMVAQGKLSSGMENAFRTAVIVLRLANNGAFARSPVGYASTDGVVH